MNLHIVMDSTAHPDPAWLAMHPNVHIVPLSVEFAGHEYKENELEAEDLFSLIDQGKGFPKTSQPAPGVFQGVFEPLLQEGAEIVVITLAAALSGTVRSAKLAQSLCGSVACDKIAVVDSGTTAIGMVQLAEDALTAAAQGVAFSEIVAKLRNLAAKNHTFFVPGTLEYLHKGGRIGGAAALFGGILKIRPVLYLVEGKVEILEKVRTRSRAIERMVDEIVKLAAERSVESFGVVHIGAADEGEKLRDVLQERLPQASFSLSTGGSVLAAHLGPGLVGVIVQERL
ncbi:MAG: DegV family protein [Sporomusaceae bacterium]|nr:DegV family protein [Sporomusaceae bacterium]